MPEADGETPLIARTVETIDAVDADAWDALANPPDRPFNPFVAHAFLSAVERSGSTGPRAGWLPHHLLLEREDGALLGAAPTYLKGHSFGEYVFDHAWADAYERAGGRYYPKLLIAAPFTPAAGPRLLAPTAPARRALASAAAKIANQNAISSVHVNFADEAEWAELRELGYLGRTGRQYHWRNRGYRDFQDFLDALASRKRKALRKERAAALEGGIEVARFTGADLTEARWDEFWTFYQDTGARKWGRPYLTRRFFSLLGEGMGERVLLLFAMKEGRPVAGALNLIGGDCLYGRYWGCTEHVPFLHFELCYYQAIDYAIEAGLDRVEAGAQGEHKIARGYEPVTTYSAHWIADGGFRDAVARYLDAERDEVDADIALLRDFTPFKKNG